MEIKNKQFVPVILFLLVVMAFSHPSSGQMGNSIENAIPIEIGIISGELNDTYPEIFYSFDVIQGFSYHLNLSFDAANEFEMEIYDTNGAQRGYSSPYNPSIYEFIAAESGTMIIAVYSIWDYGAFKLEITEKTNNQSLDLIRFADKLKSGNFATWEVYTWGNQTLVDVPYSDQTMIKLDILSDKVEFSYDDVINQNININDYYKLTVNDSMLSPKELFSLLTPVGVVFNDGTSGGIREFIRASDLFYSNYSQFELETYYDYLYVDYTFDNGTIYEDISLEYNLDTGLMESLYYSIDNFDTNDYFMYDIYLYDSDINTYYDDPYDGSDDDFDSDIGIVRFSDDLQEGMEFTWNATFTGSTDFIETPFSEGNSIELRILQDAPSFNISEGDASINTAFQLGYNGNFSDENLEDLLIFMLPVDAEFINGSKITNEVLISSIFGLNSTFEQSTTGDTIEYSMSMTFENIHEEWTMNYNASSGILQKLSISINDETGQTSSLLLELNNSALDDNSGDEGDGPNINFDELPLPLSSVILGMALVVLLNTKIIRKKNYD